MFVNVVIIQAGARPRPGRGLVLTFQGRWFSPPIHAFILDIAGTLSCGGRVLTDAVIPTRVNWPNMDLALMQEGNEYAGSLFAPLTAGAINYVQDNGGEGDIALSLTLRVRWQEAEQQQGTGGTHYVPGAVRWSETT